MAAANGGENNGGVGIRKAEKPAYWRNDALQREISESIWRKKHRHNGAAAFMAAKALMNVCSIVMAHRGIVAAAEMAAAANVGWRRNILA